MLCEPLSNMAKFDQKVYLCTYKIQSSAMQHALNLQQNFPKSMNKCIHN